MRFTCIVLSLLFCGCRASDVVPDEFRVDYGHSWADSTFDKRQTDFDTQSNGVGFGFTWYLGKNQTQSELDRQHELIMQLTRAMAMEHAPVAASSPVPVVVRVEEERPPPVPEPTKVEPAPHVESVVAPVTPSVEPAQQTEHGPSQRDRHFERGSKENPQNVTLGGISGSALEYLFYAVGALILTLVTVVKRKMLVDVGVRVKHEVHRRVKGEPKKPKHPHEHRPPSGPRAPSGM